MYAFYNMNPDQSFISYDFTGTYWKKNEFIPGKFQIRPEDCLSIICRLSVMKHVNVGCPIPYMEYNYIDIYDILNISTIQKKKSLLYLQMCTRKRWTTYYILFQTN